MPQRPRSITIISWLFILFGSVALISGFITTDLKSHWYVHLSRLLQIVAGVFMLYGRNWARWLLVAWIAFHIIISALHSVLLLLMHVAIFSVILFFVFRRQASAFFNAERPGF
ncbi:MAG TPA: hypothetical protein VKB05_12085 [Pyrinomonadaceae bacterium]|nr:hypothetical protein [Pyrinomonadaceae bacterium]